MLVFAMLLLARPRNECAAGSSSELESDESESESDSDELSLLSDLVEVSALGVPARPKKRLWKRGRVGAVEESDAAAPAGGGRADVATVEPVAPNRGRGGSGGAGSGPPRINRLLSSVVEKAAPVVLGTALDDSLADEVDSELLEREPRRSHVGRSVARGRSATAAAAAAAASASRFSEPPDELRDTTWDTRGEPPRIGSLILR